MVLYQKMVTLWTYADKSGTTLKRKLYKLALLYNFMSVTYKYFLFQAGWVEDEFSAYMREYLYSRVFCTIKYLYQDQ